MAGGYGSGGEDLEWAGGSQTDSLTWKYHGIINIMIICHFRARVCSPVKAVGLFRDNLAESFFHSLHS